MSFLCGLSDMRDTPALLGRGRLPVSTCPAGELQPRDHRGLLNHLLANKHSLGDTDSQPFFWSFERDSSELGMGALGSSLEFVPDVLCELGQAVVCLLLALVFPPVEWGWP